MQQSSCGKRGGSTLSLLSLLSFLLACQSEAPQAPTKTPAAASASQAKQATPSKIAETIQQLCARMAEQGVTTDAAQPDIARQFSSPLLSVDADARLQVYVKLDTVNEGVLQGLKEVGFQIEMSNDTLRLVQGWGSCPALTQLATLETVQHIQPPDYAAAR